MTGRRRHGPVRRVRDDSGAVAIIVALSFSTLLIGFGSFAIDLGNLYARRAAAQATADLAATAGATQMPDIALARAKALAIMCAPENQLQGWPSWVCGGGTGWYSDGNPANGEINFYTEDENNDGVFNATELIPNAPGIDARTDGVAIRVALPPATVTFGLAAVWGFNSSQAVAAATARIGTPAGMGVLPFAAQTSDMTAANQNRFCVQDGIPYGGTAWPGPRPVRGRTIYAPLIDLTPATILVDGQFVITSTGPAGGPGLPTGGTTVHFYRGPAPTDINPTLPATVTGGQITVDTSVLNPPLKPGTYAVWVSGTGNWRGRPRSIVSWTATLTVTGTVDPCLRQEAGRGVLEVANGVTGANDLERDVKAGVGAAVHQVQDWPLPALTLTPPLITSLANTLNCSTLDTLLGFSRPMVTSTTGSPAQDVNCALLDRSGFTGDLTSGLLDQSSGDAGRLVLGGGCTSDRTTVRGYTFDNSELFGDSGNPLVYPADTGSSLLTAVESDTAPIAGRITNQAFRCGRLGLLPVMNPATPAPSGPGITDDAPIVGYVYGWIDNEDIPGHRGLTWNSTQVSGVRIHILDPGWFNPVVSGSPVVTKFLGTDLPKQVVLMRDQDDPTP